MHAVATWRRQEHEEETDKHRSHTASGNAAASVVCCTRRRHATDRMCAFDTAASQHAADEDNRHATLARTQLTATKARTQGSVDIRRRHANRPRRDPRTARACQRALQSPRSSPTKARVVKTEKRTADERVSPTLCKGIEHFQCNFSNVCSTCVCALHP